MKLSEFTIDLPNELIATYPTQERDESRLMVINKKEGTIEHKMFKDILNYFDDKDIILANNTKVFPARLFGKKEKTGANIEVFLLRELNSDMKLWDVMVDPARKIRVGNKISFGGEDDLIAEVVETPLLGAEQSGSYMMGKKPNSKKLFITLDTHPYLNTFTEMLKK